MRKTTLADGSVVGWYEYGDPAGKPVFAFHGVPASGAGFAWADEPAKARGLWVLAPDRSGIGATTRRRGDRQVADYAADVAAFADALGLDRFGVWGYSGGGPYAAACAALLPDRVSHAVVSAGMGQIGVWATASDFAKTDQQMLDLARRRPWLARRILSFMALVTRLAPSMATKSMADELLPSDLDVIATMGSPAEQMEMFSAAFASGPAGVVDDYATVAQPWGVDVATISVALDVMQGSADTMVPLAHAEALAAAVSTATLTVWPDEGHFATVAHVAEILDRFV